MKLQAMIERMIRISKQIMAPLLCILLCILILKQVSIYERITDIYDSFLPILMGGVLAFLFQPLIDYLAHKFPLRVSVMIVYVGLFFIGSLFVVLLVPVVYRQVLDFVNVIPAWIEKIEHFMQTYHITYNHLEELKETYFKEGYSDEMREAIAQCFDDYLVYAKEHLTWLWQGSPPKSESASTIFE
ncbi:MAG: AI-2E family transporter, partial [Longicatena sp.]